MTSCYYSLFFANNKIIWACWEKSPSQKYMNWSGELECLCWIVSERQRLKQCLRTDVDFTASTLLLLILVPYSFVR